MKIALFGASGMIGHGVLRECLKDPSVSKVISVGRRSLVEQHPKLIQHAPPDLFDLRDLANDLTGLDACFFCLGVSAAGMSDARYRHITHDLTVSVASTLLRLNPGMSFVYVSGAGSDSTGQGRAMWARVKGATENALLRMPFKAAFMFRPNLIIPLDGIKSRTRSYRLFYKVAGPLLKLTYGHWPSSTTTTENMGLAMLNLMRHGGSDIILHGQEINRAAGGIAC